MIDSRSQKEPWFGWDAVLRKPTPLNWKARALLLAPFLFGVLIIPTLIVFSTRPIFFWLALAGLVVSVAAKMYFVFNRIRLPEKNATPIE
jgi:hypothetical protein